MFRWLLILILTLNATACAMKPYKYEGTDGALIYLSTTSQFKLHKYTNWGFQIQDFERKVPSFAFGNPTRVYGWKNGGDTSKQFEIVGEYKGESFFGATASIKIPPGRYVITAVSAGTGNSGPPAYIPSGTILLQRPDPNAFVPLLQRTERFQSLLKQIEINNEFVVPPNSVIYLGSFQLQADGECGASSSCANQKVVVSDEYDRDIGLLKAKGVEMPEKPLNGTLQFNKESNPRFYTETLKH